MITNKTEVIKRAIELYEQGYTVLPTQNFTKHPCIKWETYQHKRPTLNRLLQLFGMNNVTGLCVLTGKIEGKNVYHVVLELGANIAGLFEKVYAQICSHIHADNACWVEQSNSGGYHFHFLVESDKEVDCLRSQKIVLDSKSKTLVETKGQGGLIVVAPTLAIADGKGWRDTSANCLSENISLGTWQNIIFSVRRVIENEAYRRFRQEAKPVGGSFSVEVKVTPKNRAEKISHLLALFGVPDALIEQIEAECSK